MTTIDIFLVVLLCLSLLLNGVQWYQWNSYRTKSSGSHSHTVAAMPKITRDQIRNDRRKK